MPPPGSRRYNPGMTPQDDRPYCKNCNYPLVGLTSSSRCPECGKPIVEVLVRDSFPGGRAGRRYTSKATVLGLPLVAIASGAYGAEKIGKPVGFIAIGDQPRGVIAIGGFSLGVIAVGGVARGVIAFGGVALGVIAVGGLTVGALAFGGVALCVWGVGGCVFTVAGGVGGVVKRIWPF